MTRSLLLTLAIAVTLPAGAQNTSITEPPPQPFLQHLGKFIDSGSTGDFSQPTRTLRASAIKVAREHDRIYMKAGGGVFAAYDRASLVSRIGNPLSTGSQGEKYLPFDMSVDPQRSGSGWQTVIVDGQERLADFDWDSRGYVYLAYTIWGFGIVDSAGVLQAQVLPQNNEAPSVIVAFPHGDQFYVIASDTLTGATLYNVTNPRSPQRVRPLSFSIRSWARNRAGDTIAMALHGSKSLHLYTPSALVNGGPSHEIAPAFQNTTFGFVDVTSDGSNFYAAQQGYESPPPSTYRRMISRLAPVPGGWQASTLVSETGKHTLDILYEAGYLIHLGFFNSGGHSAMLYQFDGSDFQGTDVNQYVTYYDGVAPYSNMRQIVPFCTGGQLYAAFAFDGLGGLLSLSPSPTSCRPGAPADVVAIPGNGEATVWFDPPAPDEGPILSYIVKSDPEGIEVSGASSPIVLPLTNGTTYTFTVTATNTAGSGPPSAPSNAATPAGSLLPPALLTATAQGTASVSVQWSAAAYATHYQVLRKSAGGALAVVGESASLAYTDVAVNPETTYVYAIQSADDGGSVSNHGPFEPATTIVFTNDPLAAGTTVRAAHITELRTAVEAMRAAAGLPPSSFTDPDLAAGTLIKAAHLTELRNALAAARHALELGGISHAEPSIVNGSTIMRTTHIDELRDGVR